MKTKLAFLALAATVGCASTPLIEMDDATFVARIDRSVRLPADAPPVAAYKRYYAVSGVGADRTLRGVWVGPAIVTDEDPPGVYIVDERALPQLFTHAGCAGMVTVTATVRSNTLYLECDVGPIPGPTSGS